MIDDRGGDAAGALLARKTWRTLEPLHGMVYFVPEAAEAYARLGITGRAGYFASRAAPMGAVTADVVVSTFFNFNPELVHAAIPAVWEVATPVALVRARFTAVDAAYRRLLGEEVLASDEMQRAAELARLAAEEASRRMEGRPLAAAHANVAWPAHAAPGAVARPVDPAGVPRRWSHRAARRARVVRSGGPGDPRRSRRCPGAPLTLDAGLASGGLGRRGRRTAAARVARAGRRAPLHRSGRARSARRLEDGTDALAAAPYAVLGEERCAELRALARPWSTTLSQQLP